MTKIYVASKTHHADRWKEARNYYNIISTWIDEAGPNQTKSLQELWIRILNEIKECDTLVFYLESSNELLKGAFVEAGMAIALDKKVRVILGPSIDLDANFRPVGSWVNHPNVTLYTTFTEAFSGLERQ